MGAEMAVGGVATGKRLTLRLGERDVAALAEARRRWGVSDDSEALRESLRRAVEECLTESEPASDGQAERQTACQTDDAARQTRIEARQTETAPCQTGAEVAAGVALLRLGTEGDGVTCVGRDEEIGRVRDVLAKRQRNSVLLAGAAGVGKSAIVRAVAESMGAAGEGLTDVVWLSGIGASGAAGRHMEAGQRVVWEVDERECAYVASRCEVAARLETVKLRELSREATVEVLRAHRPALEAHHGVKVSDEALELAAAMAQNVVQPKVLPGTAVDLLDEAAGRARRVRGACEAIEVVAEDVAEVAARRSGTAVEKIWRR